MAAENELKSVLSYCDKPLVSADNNHIPFSSNFDALQTKVNGSLVKVMAWYDNEWGFCNRMLDNSLALLNAQKKINTGVNMEANYADQPTNNLVA